MTDLVRVEQFSCSHYITLTGYGHVWVRTYAICPNCGQIRFITWKDTKARVANRMLLWAPGVSFIALLVLAILLSLLRH